MSPWIYHWFPLGYNLVATIPAGATNITIEELKNSRSYLGEFFTATIISLSQLVISKTLQNDRC